MAFKNVEIKAKLENYEKMIEKLEALCESRGEIIRQEDTFFNVPNGRLKLRKREDYSVSELLYYERPDVQGPKLSVYSKCSIPHGGDLLIVLEMALGVRGIVKKTRRLFQYEHTRIHIDQVEGLGNFIELEVCLKRDQTPEEGQVIAEKIMGMLEIDKGNLVNGAYIDLFK